MKLLFLLFLASLISCIQLFKDSQCNITKDFQSVFSDASKYEEFMKNFKNKMHKIPEVSEFEIKTSSLIAEELRNIGASLSLGWASTSSDKNGYGVIAQFGTGHSPCIGVVVGIDAPNVADQTSQGYNSSKTSYNHMSGNDINTAILLGAAKIIKQYESTLEGTVKLIFQPRHESNEGTLRMIEEGVLNHYPKIDKMISMQIDTKYDAGKIITKPGQFTGFKQDYRITLNGEAGHIVPQKYPAIDPIPPLASIITKFSHYYSREVPPAKLDKFAYITTGNIQSDSNLTNIVAGSTTLTGTVITYLESKLEQTLNEMEDTVFKIGQSYKCKPQFERMNSVIPSLVNSQEIYETFAKVVNSSKYTIEPIVVPQLYYTEYSHYFNSIPGLLVILGAGGNDYPSIYSPYFRADETIYTEGASLIAQTVKELINNKDRTKNNDEL